MSFLVPSRRARRWLLLYSGALLLAFPAAAGDAPKIPPPDVASVLRKLAANSALSAAEVTRLTVWYGGESTLKPDADDDGDEDQQPLRPIPMVQLGAVKPPSQDDYLAVVREAQKLFGGLLEASVRTKLDETLAKATRPGYGADLGAMLLSLKAGPAAAYAMCTEALKHADDALTANNLGAALKGMREYPRALRCLLYARHLAPSLVMAASNLGWLQALMGDTVTGEATLRQALALDPDDACAAEGLGLLELARGDGRGALHRLVALLKHAYLPGASAGVQTVVDTDYVGGEPQGQEGGAAAAPPPPLEPIQHPAGKGGGRQPTFDEPPDLSTLETAVAGYDKALEWCRKGTEQMRPVIEAHHAAADRAKQARAAREAGGEPGVFYRSNDRERFVTHELIEVFGRCCDQLLEQARFGELAESCKREEQAIQERGAAELAQAMKQPPDAAAAAVKAALEHRCTALMALARKTWDRFHPAWRNYRTGVIKELLDYYDFATPWIQDVHDPAFNRELNLERELTIRSCDATARQQLAVFLGRCRIYYCQEPPPATKPDLGGELKVWADDPSDCRSAPLSMKLLAISLEGNCDKLKFEMGEGGIFAAEYKVGRDWSDDELTLFAGVGVKGAAGPVDLKAKAGVYVTFRDGQVIDYGDRGEAKAELNLGPVQVGSKLEGRLSIETGATGKFTPFYAKVGGTVK